MLDVGLRPRSPMHEYKQLSTQQDNNCANNHWAMPTYSSSEQEPLHHSQRILPVQH